MDEYISREAVLQTLQKANIGGYITERLLEIPSADVQPVKHGKWEEIEEYGGWGNTYFRCSICGDEWDLDTGTPVENGMKYCPNCGARMGGDIDG